MQTVLVDLYSTALQIAVIAYVYAVILIEPDMLLAEFYLQLRIRIGRYKWIFKPLIDCDRCVAGQIALWYSVYNSLTVAQSISLIALSIFLTQILQKIHKWTKS